ncbi:MAG: adenosylhomocysteinase [Thaumarchaeota archaeon]|jgi:adenosylhomocysteinase|nr:adenosylhomocysteinase [Nitrososphaerota archaeon]
MTGNIELGIKKIDWARRFMPVLDRVRERFTRERPFESIVFSVTLHVTKETANLVETLTDGGAKVYLTPANPLSTDDDVAEALKSKGVEVMAWRGMSMDEYFKAIDWAHSHSPCILIDDGADSIIRAHEKNIMSKNRVYGALEETTTGVIRIRALEKAGRLMIPVFFVNEAQSKKLFDNRYGTGQSGVDGIIRATSILFAGKKVVVCGYGLVGKGVANRARGLGASVIVTEVSPIRALEAVMDGFTVMPIMEAAKVGDVFITATGNVKAIPYEAVAMMKDGAILANVGHFDVEIDVATIYREAKGISEVKPFVEEIVLPNGKKVYLLAKGRVVNLVLAEGHPPDVMDMSFSNQALVSEYLVKHKGLTPGIYPVPEEIDMLVASTKLRTMGVKIDELTDEQREYLSSWKT